MYELDYCLPDFIFVVQSVMAMAQEGILFLGADPASADFICQPSTCEEINNVLSSLYLQMRRLGTKITRVKQHQAVHGGDDQVLNFWIVKLRYAFTKYHSAYLQLVLLDCHHGLKLQAVAHFDEGLQEFGRLLASHPLSTQDLSNLPPAQRVNWCGL